MDNKRINILAGTTWDEVIGYSRAVRMGNTIEVSGTAAVDENNHIVGEGNMYEQTRYILQKIEAALNEVGGEIKDVVRTRIYITDMSRWQEAGKAHGEFFRQVKPAATMVQVQRLIDERLLVEIEVTALLSA